MVDRELRQCGGWHYFYTAVGDAMAVLNLSVNFVVYVLASRRFRRGLLTTLGCRQVAARRPAELGTETGCDGRTAIGMCRHARASAAAGPSLLSAGEHLDSVM